MTWGSSQRVEMPDMQPADWDVRRRAADRERKRMVDERQQRMSGERKFQHIRNAILKHMKGNAK